MECAGEAGMAGFGADSKHFSIKPRIELWTTMAVVLRAVPPSLDGKGRGGTILSKYSIFREVVADMGISLSILINATIEIDLRLATGVLELAGIVLHENLI